jgi:hypothetical protein
VLDEAGLAPWARDRADLARHLHAQVARGRAPHRFPDPAELILGRPAVMATALPPVIAA